MESLGWQIVVSDTIEEDYIMFLSIRTNVLLFYVKTCSATTPTNTYIIYNCILQVPQTTSKYIAFLI